jgi:hypothetical protein
MFELARRQTESLREADGPRSVDQHDEAVFTVEQMVDELVDPASVTAQCLSKGHDPSSIARDALDAATGARRPPAFARRAESRARVRRNVSSSARAPKAATASDQSARASAWGHSSSHTSPVVVRSRRS